MKKYYDILRELREDRDLKQEDIANLLNTTRSYYGQYERGQRPLPIDHLIALCKFYNISSDYVLGLTDKAVSLSKK